MRPSPLHLLHRAEQVADRVFQEGAPGFITPRQLEVLIAVAAELEETWGSWNELQATRAKVVSKQITEDEAKSRIKLRAKAGRPNVRQGGRSVHRYVRVPA